MPDLSAQIKAEAQNLGFTLVGITHPDQPPHIDIYRNWLDSGFHGELKYLSTERAIERRSDPRNILPECETIIALGIPYPSPPSYERGAGSGERGQVAAYAWGDDYHEVLKPKLKAIVDFVEKKLDRAVPNRYYTDTGPILEREIAQRAGLGWIGKNSCLINPQKGSYFFLAEILLGYFISPDEPFSADHCGSCTACIDACPTDCILPDRTLDATRCISYLTIELKTAIPRDLRSKIGNWIYGCDICQQVCPWNIRFSEKSGDPAFEPVQGRPAPLLVEELSLSAEAYNQKFKHSPIKRAKRRGYLRNVVVALGNNGSPANVSPLAQSLEKDPEPLVRSHAAWALGKIGGERAEDALKKALVDEKDADTQAEIVSAITQITMNS